MTLKITYEPSVAKTYYTQSLFRVVDEEKQIGMLVVDNRVKFLGWDGYCYEYNEKSFQTRSHLLTADTLLSFTEAYKKRVNG